MKCLNYNNKRVVKRPNLYSKYTKKCDISEKIIEAQRLPAQEAMTVNDTNTQNGGPVYYNLIGNLSFKQ